MSRVDVKKVAADEPGLSSDLYEVVEDLAVDVWFDFRIGPDGVLQLVDLRPSFLPEVGYGLAEVDARGRWIDLVHNDDREHVLEAVRGLLGNEEQRGELRIVTSTGEHRALRYRSRPMWSASEGRVVRIAGVAWDVSETREAETRLRESQFRMTALTAGLPVGIYQTDRRGGCVYVNPRWCEITGLTREAAEGFEWLPQVHPADRERVLAQINGAVAASRGATIEFRFTRADGAVRWLRGEAVSESDERGELSGFIGIITDVTERRSFQLALEQAEERWRSLVEHSPSFVMVVDRQAGILYQSRTLPEMDVERLLGTSMLDLVEPEYRALVRGNLERVFRTGEAVSHTTRGVGANGSMAWYASQLVPILRAGAVAEVMIITDDITVRIEAEEALRESEARWRLLVENAPDYILEIDRWGTLLFLNRPQRGLELEDVLGKRVTELAPRDSRQVIEEVLRRVFEDGESVSYEVQGRSDQGEQIWYACRLAPLETLGRDGKAIMMSRDITAEKRAGEDLLRTHQELVERGGELARTIATLHQEIQGRERVEMELRRSRSRARALSSRLLSVQEEERRAMAREIHDELGQALTAIRLDVAWAQKHIAGKPNETIRKLDHTKKLIDDTIGTVRRMAGSLRPGALDDLGLAAAMEWQVAEFKERTGVKCELSVEPEEIEVGDVLAVTLFRVFQETLTNVVRHAAASRVEVRLRQEAKTVTLVVADDGRGIRKSEISSPGSLGLVGMRERVRLCGGHLHIRGDRDRGTVVRVKLPRGGDIVLQRRSRPGPRLARTEAKARTKRAN